MIDSAKSLVAALSKTEAMLRLRTAWSHGFKTEEIEPPEYFTQHIALMADLSAEERALVAEKIESIKTSIDILAIKLSRNEYALKDIIQQRWGYDKFLIRLNMKRVENNDQFVCAYLKKCRNYFAWLPPSTYSRIMVLIFFILQLESHLVKRSEVEHVYEEITTANVFSLLIPHQDLKILIQTLRAKFEKDYVKYYRALQLFYDGAIFAFPMKIQLLFPKLDLRPLTQQLDSSELATILDSQRVEYSQFAIDSIKKDLKKNEFENTKKLLLEAWSNEVELRLLNAGSMPQLNKSQFEGYLLQDVKSESFK